MKNLLIAGGGGIGERHIRCFLATGKVSISLCEKNESRSNQLKEKYRIESIFTNFKNVPLKDFDAVLIATPPPFHIPMATRCAEEGVPFLLEKPLSLNLKGVERLSKIIRKKDLVAGVAYARRSLPSSKKLRELILDGLIGEVKMGRFDGGQEYPKYRPDYQKIYYAFERMGGGCILDAASHTVNLAEWFFGKAKEVVSLYDRLELKKVECEDSSIILLRFKENRALVEIFVNQFQKPNITEIELIGTKGNLRYDVEGEIHKITLCSDDKNRWKEIERFCYSSDDRYILQAREFLAALNGKNSLPTSIEEAESTLRICLAAKESQKKNKILKV